LSRADHACWLIATLEVAYQVDHLAAIIRGDVVLAEPELLEHP